LWIGPQGGTHPRRTFPSETTCTARPPFFPNSL